MSSTCGSPIISESRFFGNSSFFIVDFVNLVICRKFLKENSYALAASIRQISATSVHLIITYYTLVMAMSQLFFTVILSNHVIAPCKNLTSNFCSHRKPNGSATSLATSLSSGDDRWPLNPHILQMVYTLHCEWLQ